VGLPARIDRRSLGDRLVERLRAAREGAGDAELDAPLRAGDAWTIGG